MLGGQGAEEPGCRGAGGKESCIPGTIETFAWFSHEVVIHRVVFEESLSLLTHGDTFPGL